MRLVDDPGSGSGPGGAGYCALLTSAGVDCWGGGNVGELGNGASSDSATPLAVEGAGGTGTLAGVTSLVNDCFNSYCALLTSGGVDCWGLGTDGVLGDGASDRQSTSPVPVEGVGATGTLTEVTSLIGGNNGNLGSFCAALTSSGVDCWGEGFEGVLGNGTFSRATTPVEVG